jgi:hypothetical protein
VYKIYATYNCNERKAEQSHTLKKYQEIMNDWNFLRKLYANIISGRKY